MKIASNLKTLSLLLAGALISLLLTSGGLLPKQALAISHTQVAQNTSTSDPTVKPVSDDPASKCSQADCAKGVPTTLYTKYLNPLINLLSAAVGIVVIIMLIIGGIQYSTAGGDPNKVQAAKKRIYNALFALLAFIFLYTFLQWIVPGGLFG